MMVIMTVYLESVCLSYVLQDLIQVLGEQPCRCGLQFTALELGLGGCNAAMFPTTGYYALDWYYAHAWNLISNEPLLYSID